MPSQAVRELERDPELTVLDVIEVRAYARCKDAYDHAKGDDDERMDAFQDSQILEDVIRITKELYDERRPRTNFKARKEPTIVLTDRD